MRIGKYVAAAALCAFLGGAATGEARADGLRDVARATAAKASKAVVTVKLVLKVKVQGRDLEQKIETIGTVIDPSGLTVVSAVAADPLTGRRRGGAGGQTPQIESEVSDTMIVLEDGTEIEADVVFKDADLDVAFVRPREAQKLDAVELKPRGKAPVLLEEVFVVTRLGSNESRATSVELGSVRAVVKGPKTHYLCTSEVSGETGCVAYAADGAPMGIFVNKLSDAGGGGGGGGGRGGRGGRGGGMGGGGFGAVSVVLRPIEDILDVVKQAKEAKAPEHKAAPEEKKPEAGGDAPKAGGDAPKPGDEKKPTDAKPGEGQKPADGAKGGEEKKGEVK